MPTHEGGNGRGVELKNMVKWTYAGKRLLVFLLSSPKLFVNKKVLDAGGHTGDIMYRLHDTVLSVLLDTDKIALRKSSVNIRVLGDIEHLPFRANSFDLAHFTEVLEHLHDPQKAIYELSRTFKRVVVTTPNNSMLRKTFWIIRRKNRLSSKDHIREYSPSETRRFFFNASYTLLMFGGLGFIVKKPKALRSIGERFPYLSSKVLMVYERRMKDIHP